MGIRLAAILYLLMHTQNALGADFSLHIGMHSVKVSIANTPYQRELGLMQTRSLCENCGMLFVFPKPGKHGFWMKDTPLPLSIAFIAKDGHIINLDEMEAQSKNTHTAKGAALYALEMNKGWFHKRAIKPQAFVQGLQQIPRGE